MSEPAASRAGAGAPPSPAEVWDGLVRPDVEGTADYWADVSARMRDARLTFGGRPLCPFLRPFFIDAADEARVRTVAETIAAIGERVVAAAMAQPELLRRVRLTEAETRLARIDPGYGRASTTSRLDAFLLPDSLTFAEYNAESPAGLAYAENLGEVFDGLDLMTRFRERFEAVLLPPVDAPARRAARQLRRVGRPGQPADHPDHRLPRRPDLERVPDPEGSLRGARRPDGRRRSSRPELRRHDAGGRRPAHRHGVSPRARQRRDRARRRLPRPGRRDRQRGGVHGQRLPLQDPAQEGVLRAADRRRRDRARRAVSAERRGARHRRRGDPVDARGRGRAHHLAASRDDRPARLRPRASRLAGAEAERRIRRQRRHARLGDERRGVGQRAGQGRRRERPGRDRRSQLGDPAADPDPPRERSSPSPARRTPWRSATCWSTSRRTCSAAGRSAA